MFELCTDAASVRRVHKQGKIASMIGVEGGHQTGNSLGALRIFFESGVRYMTITHNSDNAFGTCWKSVDPATGKDAGLSKFGQECIREMNRLGMMVDLAHVSPNTMRGVLEVARAPVIFSHSGAYSVTKHGRNVPDDVIRSMKTNGGILMIPAVNAFMNLDHPEDATVEDMIDHILWVVELAGWEHVGLGSDFDGYTGTVKGLEVINIQFSLCVIDADSFRGHIKVAEPDRATSCPRQRDRPTSATSGRRESVACLGRSRSSGKENSESRGAAL